MCYRNMQEQWKCFNVNNFRLIYNIQLTCLCWWVIFGFFLFAKRCVLIVSHYRCNVSANQPCTMNQHVSWHSTALVTPFWKLSVLCICAAALVRSWRHHKERRRSFSPCSNAPRTGLRLRKVKNLLSYTRPLAMKCLPGSQSCVKEVEIYLTTVISHKFIGSVKIIWSM